MIHRIVIGFIGFVYEFSKSRLGVSYKLAFFEQDGKLIHLIDCPRVDYRDWQHVDMHFGTSVAFILIWKDCNSTFDSKEAQFLLNFIKEDQDPIVYDGDESQRRSSLIAKLINPSCVLVAWPNVKPPAYSTSWASFENENKYLVYS